MRQAYLEWYTSALGMEYLDKFINHRKSPMATIMQPGEVLPEITMHSNHSSLSYYQKSLNGVANI